MFQGRRQPNTILLVVGTVKDLPDRATQLPVSHGTGHPGAGNKLFRS